MFECDECGAQYVNVKTPKEVDALQARVKDQAETLLVQKSIYETLCEKVNGLETQLTISWKKKADRLLIENARLQKLVDMNQKVIDAARRYLDLCTGADSDELQGLLALKEALRELDGEKTECTEHGPFLHTPDNKTACGKCHKILV